MGYDLHVTRAEFWADNDADQIRLDEWVAVAEADPQLERPDRGEHSPAAGGDGFFVARALYEDGQDAWFDWHNGDVFTKNPGTQVIRKLHELAEVLGAVVQGDDGEHYDEQGQPVVDDRAGIDPADAVTMPERCTRCGRKLGGLGFHSLEPSADGVRSYCPFCTGREAEPLSRRERLVKLLRVN